MCSVMNGLVGETQTTLVHGRQILDDTLIVNDVHWVKMKKRSTVIMKIDFHKACDLIRRLFVD